MRELVAVSLAVLISWSPSVQAQPVTHVEDQEVVKGIKQVDDGDYDGAILTLDAATRRLAAEPAKVRDLSQAFLYLGIAYAGKGQEAAARARFREALGQIKDLSLSPESFPPKVINLFEAAREEVAREAPSVASPAKPTPQPSPSSPPAKGGGSGKTLLIVGGVAAVGGGVALAAGGSSKPSPSTPTPSPSPSGTTTSTFTGTVGPQNSSCNPVNLPQFTPTRSGTLTATMTWVDASQVLQFTLNEAGNGQTDGSSSPASNTSATLTAQVKNISYGFSVCLAGTGGVVETFTIVATYPQ